MWPNSRYSTPFFTRPQRQNHSDYPPSLSNLNTAPAHPFPTLAFTFTPPLHLPVQAPPANATPPLRNHGHGGTSDTLLTPHPPDVPLTAAQGLTSILSAMSVNHGLALDVVVAVYKRAGSPKGTDRALEAESALKGMGHRRDSCDRADTDEYDELEPRYGKENGDVEDTGTRQSLSLGRSHRGAAEWKRCSMGRVSRSPVGVHRNDNTIQSSKDENDEGERGQRGASVESHRISQVPVTPGEPPQDHKQEEYLDNGALLRTMTPQELEKKLGRDHLRRLPICSRQSDHYPSSREGSST
ncbi:hypothetical protein EDC04DRAFT_2700536 [Pisolithus marmoratus]|nr:hypothetical protein EDC04DRAFT_2700536 [Pisolithus marmoratus]